MDQALQTMIANMPEKTGKSLEEWKAVLKKKAFAKHSEAVNYLKKEHGITHGFANTIVSLSKSEDSSPEDLVAAQYKGKEQLYPIYEMLKSGILKFGEDITVSPKKGSVSFIRKRQFALVKPATKSRIDLGLKLPGKATNERLGDSGPFGSMCTHRVQLQSTEEVDKELLGWIKEAYEGS
jgi:predicted transport protein